MDALHDEPEGDDERMTDKQEPQQEEQPVEAFGEYHPEAAHYGAYNEAMAAWRNEVRAMQAMPGETAPQDTFQSVPATDALSGTPSVEDMSTPSEPLSEPETAEGAKVETITGDRAANVSEPAQDDEETVTKGDSDGGERQAPKPVQVTPGASEESGPDEPGFDPTEHNAIEVMSYLEGVGEAEAQRVLDAEEKSERPRKGIIGQRDAILKRARRNDQKNAEAASSSE